MILKSIAIYLVIGVVAMAILRIVKPKAKPSLIILTFLFWPKLAFHFVHGFIAGILSEIK